MKGIGRGRKEGKIENESRERNSKMYLRRGGGREKERKREENKITEIIKNESRERNRKE